MNLELSFSNKSKTKNWVFLTQIGRGWFWTKGCKRDESFLYLCEVKENWKWFDFSLNFQLLILELKYLSKTCFDLQKSFTPFWKNWNQVIEECSKIILGGIVKPSTLGHLKVSTLYKHQIQVFEYKSNCL